MNNVKLPMRKGVGVIILNKKNEVFVGKRRDNPINKWQMPQGGIDEGEDNLSAMKRELFEETSIRNIKILREINGFYEYELPKNLIEFNESKFVEESNFLNNFIEEEDISNNYLTPGRKRMLANKNNEIDWDFNQDFSIEEDLMIHDKVMHKKYGIGIIVKKDIDKAEVNFENFGLKKVYLKYLQIKN